MKTRTAAGVLCIAAALATTVALISLAGLPIWLAVIGTASGAAVIGHYLWELSTAWERVRKIEARDVVEPTTRRVDDDEWWEHRWELGRAFRHKDHEAVIAGLSDPSGDLRRLAARYLGRLRSRQARAALEGLLADRDPFVRSASATALGRIGMTESVPRLLEVAELDHDSFVRMWAIESIRRIDDADAVPRLIALLDDDDTGIKMCVIAALRRLGDRRALRPLQRLAQSESFPVRLACRRAAVSLRIFHRRPTTR
jgi:HEAT repeats